MERTRLGNAAGLCGVLLGVLALASPALSAVYLPMQDATVLRRGEVIVHVTSLGSRVAELPGGLPETRTRFAVIESLKGMALDEIEVGVIGGVLPNGIGLPVEGLPRFQPGQRFILSLVKRSDGIYSVAEMSIGAFDVVEDSIGRQFATRLSFRNSGEKSFRVTRNGQETFEKEPVRELDSFLSAIRGGFYQLPEATQTAPAYVATPKGEVKPAKVKITPLWDDNWCAGYAYDPAAGCTPGQTTRFRWNTAAFGGPSPAVNYCSADPSKTGQSAVLQGGIAQIQAAVSQWNSTDSTIKYGTPTAAGGTCNPSSIPAADTVRIFLNDLTMFGGVPVRCPLYEGGAIGMGAPVTDNNTHTWKGQQYKNIRAGIAWIRKFDCVEGSFTQTLFQDAITHELGHTLGTTHAEASRSQHDGVPGDDWLSVMISNYSKERAVTGLGSDDRDVACFLYGSCGEAPSQPPVARFSWGVNGSPGVIKAKVGDNVQFTDESFNQPSTWEWSFGDPSASIARVPDHTLMSSESYFSRNPVRSFMKPGTYTVTLRVSNSRGSSTASHPVQVEALPVVPGDGQQLAAKKPLYIVPSAVQGGGSFGSSFKSDGWLQNTGTVSVPLEFYYVPEEKNGLTDAGVLLATASIAPGETKRYSDLLALFNLNTPATQSISGEVQLKTGTPELLAFRNLVRASTGDDPALRFSSEIPTVTSLDGAVLGGNRLWIPGIRENDTYRTNIILSETSGAETRVEISVWDSNGLPIGEKIPVTVQPFSKSQVFRAVNRAAAGTILDQGSISVTVIGGSGRVVGLATVVDNRSNSFSAVLGRIVNPTASVPQLIIPAVARLRGANETQFTTSFAATNGSDKSANIKVTYYYNDLDAGGVPKVTSQSFGIPAFGAVKLSDAQDFISTVLGVTNQSNGFFVVEGDVSRVAATASVSALVDPNSPAKGFKTAQVDPLTMASAEVASVGGATQRFPGAERTAQKRSNLILAEVSGSSASVLLKLVDRTGNEIASKLVNLNPRQYLQINDLFGGLGFGFPDGDVFENMTVTAQVTSGTGKVVTLTTVVDNAARNPEIFVLRPAGVAVSVR